MEYAEQVTAEHKIRVKGSKQLIWAPKTSHADNHYLDCEVYAMAVADVLGVRTLSLQEEIVEEIPQNEQNINDDVMSYNENWLNKNGDSWI